jgi:hypothetical protein
MRKLLGVLIICGVVTAGWIAGCGLLDSTAGLTIRLPDQEFEFYLDANVIRGQLETAIGKEYNATISLAGLTEIPACIPSQEDCVYDLAGANAYKKKLDFEPPEFPVQQIDLSDQKDLKDYLDAGKISSVEIESISFEPSKNTLNFDLPVIDMLMDQYGVSVITESTTKKIAEVPSIRAGSTDHQGVRFTTNGRSIMSGYLLSLKFSLLAKTSFSIDTKVDRTIPVGELRGKVKVTLKFTVNPL